MPPGSEPIVHYNGVAGDYFRAMAIPLVDGRLFTERELWETGGVVIIKKGKGGKFAVDAETVGDPLWGNRYCAAGGDFTMRGAALLSSNGRREWNQKLTRRGHVLVMEEIEPAVREPGETRTRPDTCGANGTLSGTFFPVRGPKPSYGDTIGVDPPK